MEILSVRNKRPEDERSEVLSTIRREPDWQKPEDTALMWRIDDATAPFYNYLYYKIAGFTENDTFRSNQIRNGMLGREEALKIVEKENKPRFATIKQYLELINLDYDEVMRKVDFFTNIYGRAAWKNDIISHVERRD